MIALLVAVAFGVMVYRKIRPQGQEENIAMSNPTREYEEIHEPVNEEGYLSPMPNPNVSIQIPIVEEAYADPDYIVPEDIHPPPIPDPMYDRVELLPPDNLRIGPAVSSNLGSSRQNPSVEGVYNEPDYAPPGNITAPPIPMHEGIGVPTSSATPNFQLTPLPNSEVQVSLMIRLNPGISCQVKSSDDRTNPDTSPENIATSPENIAAPPMYEGERVTPPCNPPHPQTNLPLNPTVSSNPGTPCASVEGVHDGPDHAPPENTTVPPIYDDPLAINTPGNITVPPIYGDPLAINPPGNITAPPIYDDNLAISPSVYDDIA
uniref:pollen-specific leucine-rich repeat extensin-like protein 1 n=1 Tax=Styela clava TaxID=7725 RepID=UPI00193AADA5|nr:pollen-specific leucine-rich repeat extensin-like protein 1 [Styela clava]